MNWTSDDPGAGSPPDVRADAARRATTAKLMREAAKSADASALTASQWEGGAANAVSLKNHAYTEALRALASRHGVLTVALQQYASEIERIKSQQAGILAKKTELEANIAAATGRIGELRFQIGAPGEEFTRAQNALANLRESSATLSNQMSQLAEQRRAADTVAISVISGATARGGLGGLLSAGTLSPSLPLVAPSLQDLTALTENELRVLFSLHPDLVAQIQQHSSAEEVASWWTQLSSDERQTLMLGASSLIGSLNGVSPSARVGANLLNASARQREVASEIAALKAEKTAPGFGNEVAIQKLQAEQGYLQKVTAGEIQLYLYDSDSASIIEMIGTPSIATARTLTYVPGTFTSELSFYKNEVQPVARWLTKRDTEMVAFVWKEGSFPGEDPQQGNIDLLRIGESNDDERAATSGQMLREFEVGLRASSDHLAATTQIAAGHSWGLLPITEAEELDVHFDQVHSLAGAGMPENWRRDEETSYHHWAYLDILGMAQLTGQVWDGRVPQYNEIFSQHLQMRDDEPLGYYVPLSDRLMDNHNLIASDRPENQEMLDDLRFSMTAK